jgi:hypothetical protein
MVQNSNANNALSRLYCEQGSELRMIGPYCFDQYSTLTYFEFPTTLRQICQYAFRLTAIENQVLGSENTIYIGTYAFNQALRGSYVKVPGSVNMLDTRIGTYCSRLQDGWTLQIGDSAHYSYLDLSKYNGGNLITINDRAAFV